MQTKNRAGAERTTVVEIERPMLRIGLLGCGNMGQIIARNQEGGYLAARTVLTLLENERRSSRVGI